MVQDPARRRTKRVGAGSSSTTGARSAALPARSDGFDNVDGGPERGVYIQMRGIEQVRIRRGFQRARPPGWMSRSSRRRMSARTSASSTAPPAACSSSGAAAGAHLRRRGDEDLHLGIREDDRADVAAVEHRARAGCGRNRAESRAAPPAPPGSPRPREAASPTAWLLSARLVESRRDRARARPRPRRVAIVERLAGIEQRLRHRAVDQAGIEMPQPIVGGEPLAERALAGGRRPVDGDDHGRAVACLVATGSGKPAHQSGRRSSGSWWR